MAKVIIAGGGIAGLAAGVYAQKSGFETIIYEPNRVPGGVCTGWRRKGYFFEGGMHWLTGSSPRRMLHRVWHEVGALSPASRIITADPFMVCLWEGERICLYRDPDRLEDHLCALSPEDGQAIKNLCLEIRRFMPLQLPVLNLPGLKVREKSPPPLGTLLGMLPALSRVLPLGKQRVADYAARFHHPGIRLLLSGVVPPEYDTASLIYTLANFASGDGGYVEGGSPKLSAGMAGRFTELGGVIRYGERIRRIVVKNGRAAGVVSGDEYIPADAVIAAVDPLTAVDTFFDEPVREGWIRRMRRGIPLVSTFVCMGVEADLSSWHENVLFPLKKPYEYGGRRFTGARFYNYAAYPGYAPKGCSVLTTILLGDTYEYWKDAGNRGLYDQRKEELFETIRDRFGEQIPDLAGKVAVWDVATPLTYERFCGSFHGSWMTMTPPGSRRIPYPCAIRGIDNLYFAGHRMRPPGGMPVAVSSGRTAAQRLCRDFGAVFG
ncbi:MAG: NAD(P)/FAD-dependent oxidoreductase [Treponema sp.]|jgi:phytoene dehydrogenase-like protein|nr:NAD(P)/FAD-dependent oxidoreductase [Treponema sp.]